MDTAELLLEGHGRIGTTVRAAVRGLTVEQLGFRPGRDANSIGWLVWHLTRIQDDHIAEVAGRDQVWSDGWSDRFALPFDPVDTGYGHDRDDIAAVRVSADDLLGYHEATSAVTAEYLGGLTGSDLDRVVDANWDPPVTLGVRLISVLNDDLQHAGQAAYVRGLL